MVVLPLYIPHFSCSYRILKGAVPIPSYIRHPLVKIRVEVRFLLFHYLADETSTTKTTPPLIMLPECAVKTSNTSFTQLAGYLTENATFLSECLDQIRHVSQCHQLESDCSYPLCVNLKRDIFHSCVCTDDNCQRCQYIRPLILLHSITCKDDQCQINLCPRYRAAWSLFEHSLQGLPVPRINLLFTHKLELPKVKTESHETAPSGKKLHSRNSKNSNTDTSTDLPPKSPSMMSFNQSALSCDLESTPKQVSYTPLSAYTLPTQSLSSPPSPLSQQVSSKPVSDAKMATSVVSVEQFHQPLTQVYFQISSVA